MNPFVTTIPFDVTGEFGGIVFTDAGKRRLVLRVGGAERFFKLPKHLRRRMAGFYRLGQTVRVHGVEERDRFTGVSKWVVAEALPLDAPSAANTAAVTSPVPLGPIRVCAKKTCWRQGGCELFRALERGIEARGLAGEVRVKAVGCLDRCNQGPNVDWDGREFTRCSPRDAETLLDQVVPAEAVSVEHA